MSISIDFSEDSSFPFSCFFSWLIFNNFLFLILKKHDSAWCLFLQICYVTTHHQLDLCVPDTLLRGWKSLSRPGTTRTPKVLRFLITTAVCVILQPPSVTTCKCYVKHSIIVSNYLIFIYPLMPFMSFIIMRSLFTYSSRWFVV